MCDVLYFKRWLLEFDNFSREDNSKSEGKPARPLTESHLILNRPKWFKELSQKRRLSEIPDMETEDISVDLTNNTSSDLSENSRQNPSKESYPRISNPEMVEQEVEHKLPIENKLSSEWLYLSQNGDSKISQSGNSSSEGSKYSLPTDINFLEEDILSFSTRKSIDNLRITNVPSGPSVLPVEECIIPDLPSGNELVFYLLSNWGDEKYIGMNEIEIIDHYGKRPVIKNVSAFLGGFLNSQIFKLFMVSDLSTGQYQQTTPTWRIAQIV